MNIQSNYEIQLLAKDRWQDYNWIAKANRMIKAARKPKRQVNALEVLQYLVKSFFRRSANAQS